MSRVEALARDLISCYELEVTPIVFHGDTPVMWRAYHPQLGPADRALVYDFDDWMLPLLGMYSNKVSVLEDKCRDTLSDFVAVFSNHFSEIVYGITWHVDPFVFRSLDELDILLTLAGKRTHTAS